MHIHRERVGRGPTKAQAFFRRNVVVVVMEDALTRGEKNLVAAGRAAAARAIRAHYAQMMRGDLVAAVQELTGGLVVAFLHDSSAEPDVSVQLFVLDRPVSAELAGEASEVASLGADGDGRRDGAGVSHDGAAGQPRRRRGQPRRRTRRRRADGRRARRRRCLTRRAADSRVSSRPRASRARGPTR